MDSSNSLPTSISPGTSVMKRYGEYRIRRASAKQPAMANTLLGLDDRTERLAFLCERTSTASAAKVASRCRNVSDNSTG